MALRRHLPRVGSESARNIERRELAFRIQEAMHVNRISTAREHCAIASDDVAVHANPQHIGEERADRIDLCELASAQHESAPRPGGVSCKAELAHDVAAGVYPCSHCEVGAWVVNRNRLAVLCAQESVFLA